MRREKSKNTFLIRYTLLSTPLGLTGIAATEAGLLKISLNLKNKDQFLQLLEETYLTPVLHDPKSFTETILQLEAYFSGKLKRFTCKLDISRGTEFQQSIWRKLQTIPYGQTRSYQWMAQAIGRPLAMRAVGNANGKNPLPLIIPCHRVIRANGALGGYTGGSHLKKFFLHLESTSHAPV